MTSERKSWAEIPKMWITYDDTGWIEYVHPQKIPNTVGWVRADLVDELIEALEITAELVEALGHTAKKARAALTKIKEEK